LEKIPYLFVSLGDGSVISYVISKDNSNANDTQKVSYELTERRKVLLGTQPTILRKFHTYKPTRSSNIFACSDRPSVISSTNQKLNYSSVNLKQVDYMCELNSKVYPNNLALLSFGMLRIGTMDTIQKLHIRTVPLNETVRRICYQSETHSFGIITYRLDYVTQNGQTKPLIASASTQCSSSLLSKPATLIYQSQIVESNSHENELSASNGDYTKSGTLELQAVNSFLILDQNTFEVLHSVQFQSTEYAISIVSMSFDSDPHNAYYVVGCSYVNEEEPEPKSGRLIVLKYFENKLTHVCEREIKGAPYCMQAFNGKLLVSVNNSLKLFEYKDNALNSIASYSDNVFIVHLKCKNDFILIGDMMKSCSILNYRADCNTFELVARDFTPIWLNSLEMIDDDNFLMSDCFFNIISLKKDRYTNYLC
jgi:DNA damage-binding protein 1